MSTLAHPEMLAAIGDDPWSLELEQRRDLLERLADEQAAWLPRLAPLVEPPAPARDFPAFLLATARFERLAAAIRAAPAGERLDTGTADELQRFVDLYRCYMSRREP